MKYYLLVTYPYSGKQHLMSTPTNAVAATDENKHLLLQMGAKLLTEGVITSYQLACTAGDEVNVFNKDFVKMQYDF